MDKKVRQRILVPLVLGVLAGLPIWAAFTGKAVIGYFATAAIFLYGLILAFVGIGFLIWISANDKIPDRDKRVIALKELCEVSLLKKFEYLMWLVVLPLVFIATGHLFAAFWYLLFGGIAYLSVKFIRETYGHECVDAVVE